MFALARRHNRKQSPQISSPLNSDMMSQAASWESLDEAIEELRTMKRKDLISLFLDCEHPGINDLAVTSEKTNEDDWVYDGYLLDNGPILTTITNFITNVLFGKGLRWLGKIYFSVKDNGSLLCIGKNRFCQKQKGDAGQKASRAMEVVFDRTFDYSIGQSALCSTPSLINRYSVHCNSSPMSLIWRGMVDELRVIPLSFNSVCNDEKQQQEETDRVILLLGMGYFTWSGGAWNSAPFCLVARRNE